MTAKVRTVRGDIDPSELGWCDAHEHLFLTPSRGAAPFQDVDATVAEVSSLRDAGADAVVEWTPLGLGRDIDKMVQVSERTGMHVVATTGLLRTVSYPEDSPYRTMSDEDLLKEYVNDLKRDCGLIKVGGDYQHLGDWARRTFGVAAAAHAQVGTPIGVHTEHGTATAEIIEHFGSLGVQPQSLILGHVDRNPDPVVLAEAAAAGAFLQLDGAGRAKYWPDSAIIALIADLADRGHLGQLIIGGDNGKREYFRAYGGGPGMAYTFATFKPRLEKELGSPVVEAIYRDNPARAFAFEPK